MSSQGEVEEPFTKAPVPDWVEMTPVDMDSPTPYKEEGARGGVYFRLIEQQLHAELKEEFFHYADEFTTAAGIQENGELQIEFDPAYQTLALHFIQIERPDTEGPIDALASSAYRLAKPDDELSEGLFDGHTRLLFLVRDLRPGDVLHYAYTIRGSLPAYRDHVTASIPLGWSVSVAEMRYRLLKAKERPVFVKNHQTSVGYETRDLGDDLEEMVWSVKNVEPYLSESNTPVWSSLYPWVQLSQFASWGEVAEWGRGYYEFDGESLEPELRSQIERIRSENDSVEAQIIAAIRYVQDEVRYLGLVEGDQAYCPVSPNLVASRRFGDCKDKSSLLRRMLQEIGVDSDPVYVSSRRKNSIESWHPSPTAFDHVVLRIKLPNGRFTWCDTTDSHQGGSIGTLPFPEFGKGLVVEEGAKDLTDLPIHDPEQNYFEVLEKVVLGDVGESAMFTVISTYYGAEADVVRFYFDSTEPSSASRHYSDYYKESYPDIVSKGPIVVNDDRSANRFVVTEHYELPDPWKPSGDEDGYYSVGFVHETIREILSQPEISRRETPWGTAYPDRRLYKQVLELPSLKDVGDDSWYFEDETHFIEGPGIEFRRKIEWDEGREILTTSDEIEILADSVDPADIEEWISKTDQIYSLSSTELWRYIEADDLMSGEGVESDDGSDVGSAIYWLVLFGIGVCMFLGIGGIIGYSLGRKSKESQQPRPLSRQGTPRAGPPPLPPRF